MRVGAVSFTLHFGALRSGNRGVVRSGWIGFRIVQTLAIQLAFLISLTGVQRFRLVNFAV